MSANKLDVFLGVKVDWTYIELGSNLLGIRSVADRIVEDGVGRIDGVRLRLGRAIVELQGKRHKAYESVCVRQCLTNPARSPMRGSGCLERPRLYEEQTA
jgi:hypothetical protein